MQFNTVSVILTNTYIHTTLQVGYKCGNLEATKILAEQDVAFNNANGNGGTSQLEKAIKSTIEIFRYVTQICADINIRNIYSNAALHNPTYSGSVKVKDYQVCSLAKRRRFKTLHVSAICGILEAIKALVENVFPLCNIDKYVDIN